MEYIYTKKEKVPAEVSSVASGADKYYGAVAEGYDEKRDSDPKWILEQRIIEGMLMDMPQDTVVLDAPCGTGRFFDFYKSRGFIIVGLDKSEDMLRIAHSKGEKNKQRGGLVHGDVRDTKLRDKSVDVAVNCRVTRWLSPEDCQTMIREMQRVSRKRIIFTARIANHKHARTVELFESALDGWHITRNEIGVDMDYRIIVCEPDNPYRLGLQSKKKDGLAVRIKRRYILAEMVEQNGWKIGAEIGVNKGGTAFYLLNRFPDLKIIAVDNWRADNEIYGDMSEIKNGFMREAEKYGNRCVTLCGNSVDIARNIGDESLDFIFIDGDHSYEAVKADIAAWAPKVKVGGFVMGHDIDFPDVAKAVGEVYGDYRELDDDIWAIVK